MGCDIHCYIEYKPAGSDDWSDFGGRINPGRNYDLFAKLAGIRNYDEITPIAKPRGMNILIVGRTKHAKCEMCGKEEELRPYGPNGESVCFDCGMKDEEATKRQFSKRILTD